MMKEESLRAIAKIGTIASTRVLFKGVPFFKAPFPLGQNLRNMKGHK